MYARVKADKKLKNVTACTGREFVKYEYRLVPAGMEAEAGRNQYLETVEELPVTETVVEAPEIETVEEKPKRKRGSNA